MASWPDSSRDIIACKLCSWRSVGYLNNVAARKIIDSQKLQFRASPSADVPSSTTAHKRRCLQPFVGEDITQASAAKAKEASIDMLPSTNSSMQSGLIILGPRDTTESQESCQSSIEERIGHSLREQWRTADMSLIYNQGEGERVARGRSHRSS